jgi:Holliday junction resolvasome RuvABC endonuclease subunit
MRICGIDPDSDGANVAVIDVQADIAVSVVESEVRRIRLTDHEDSLSLQDFSRTLASFLRDMSVDMVAVRRCTYKGKYMSGAAALKIEAMIQVNGVPVRLISPQTIKAVRKKTEMIAPESLRRYQHEAFDAAVACAQPE